MASFEEKQGGEGQERDKIITIVPFHSSTFRNTKLKKNGKRIQKIIKYRCGLF